MALDNSKFAKRSVLQSESGIARRIEYGDMHSTQNLERR